MRGTLLMLLATVGLSSSSILLKFVYREGVGPLTMLTGRMGLATLIMLAVFLAVGRWRGYLRPNSWRHLGGCLAVAAANSASQLFYALALTELNPGLGQMIFSLNPAFMVLLMLFFGESLTGLKIARLALALTGLYFLILAGGGAGLERVTPLSLLLVIASAAIYAVHLLLYQKLLAGTSSITNTFYILGGMALIFGLAEVFQRGLSGFAAVSPVAWGWILLMALGATVIARLLMFTGIELAGGTQVALTGVAEPVLVLSGSALILGERLTALQWGGAALVVASIVLGSLAARSRRLR